MKKVAYFPVIRAISCIAVVFLHTFYLAVSGFETTFSQNVTSMIIRNCLLWAVPCFVMVSGALLLEPAKRITIVKIIRKYIRRIILAILIFTFVFVLFDSLVTGEPKGPAIFGTWLQKVWTNGSWSHMWYLYMLIALYLMLPLYRLVTRQRRSGILGYALLLFFLFLCLLPSIGYLAGKASGFYLLAYTVYPFYFFMGYAIHKNKIRFPLSAAWVLVAIGTLMLILSTYFGVRLESDALRSFSGSYASVGVALQAIGIFTLFHRGQEFFARTMPLWERIDDLSFGIYLVHMLFLHLFYRVARWNPYKNGGVALLVPLAILTLLLSAGTTYLLKRIPKSERVL